MSEGFDAVILFVIQMNNVRYFAPNESTDPSFAKALREAAGAGVEIWAYSCRVTPDSMEIADPVEICL